MEAPTARRSYLRSAQNPSPPTKNDDVEAAALRGADVEMPVPAPAASAALASRVQRLEDLLTDIRTRVDTMPSSDPVMLAEEVRGTVPSLVDERVKPVADRMHEIDDRIRRVESRLERLHEETQSAMIALETRFATIRQEVTVMLGGVVIGAIILLMLVFMRR